MSVRIQAMAVVCIVGVAGAAPRVFAKDHAEDDGDAGLSVPGLPGIATEPWEDKHGRDKEPKPKKKDAPIPVELPEVTGAAREGELFTGTAGQWASLSPVTPSFQWLRCDARGWVCTLVPGATASTFRPGTQDIDFSFRLVVSARNDADTTLIASRPTPVVIAAPPRLVEAPAVLGDAREGSTLTASVGRWDGRFNSLDVVWFRCDASGDACAMRSSGSSATIVLEDGDVDATVRVQVTAHGPGGDATALSPPSVAVRPLAPRMVASPELSGEALEESLLSASLGQWGGRYDALSLRWLRCDAAGEACVDTGVSDIQTYSPGDADVGFTLRAEIVAMGPGGSTVVLSNPSAPVKGAPPVNLAAPELSGSPLEGQLLTTSVGEWRHRVDSFSFAWYRCDASGSGCIALPGESGASLTLTESHVGATLRVQVTAIGPGGQTPALSDASGVVVFAPPRNVSPPLLSGTALEDDTLSASTGTWSGRVESHRHRWLSCDASGEGCQAVAGATTSTLVVPSSLVGRTVRAEVTAIGPGGESTALSAPSLAVVPAAPVFASLPTVQGHLAVGGSLRGDPGTVRGTPAPALSFQWQRCVEGGACADIPGATQSLYAPVSADEGSRLRLTVTATSHGDSTTASSTLTPVIAGNVPAVQYARTVLEAGPLGYWRLGETSGSTAMDASTNGRNGSYVTGASATGFTLGRAGALPNEADRSVGLDGLSGRITFGDTFDFPGIAPFTFEAWVRPTVVDANQRHLFNKEEKIVNWEGYRFAFNNALGLYCQRWNNGANSRASVPLTEFTLGSWYHVACTYDGSKIRVYVNGQLRKDAPSTLAVGDTAMTFALGDWGNGGTNSFFAGDMDEAAVFGRALSQTELAAHVAASQASPGTAPSALGLPRILGSARPGQTLTSSEGLWAGSGPMAFAHAWERCAADGSCQAIAGASSASYAVSSSDLGFALRAKVTGTNGAGNATAYSLPTPVVDERLFVEAEELERRGDVRAYVAPPETGGGTVVLGGSARGSVRIPIALSTPTRLTAWVRVRTPSEGHSALHAALLPEGPSAANRFDAPVSPVLRWQKVQLGSGSTSGAWPGLLPAGSHVLQLSGADEGVELDAFYLAEDDLEPQERFAQMPVRPIAASVRDFGAVGDGITDDTVALKNALASLTPGKALLIPAGRYRFTAPLDLKTPNTSLVGEGASSVLFADLPAGSTVHSVQILGTDDAATIPLERDVQPLDWTVTVAASAGFVAGDRLVLASDPWGEPSPNNVGPFFRNRKYYAHVTDVQVQGALAVLTLDRPVLGPFLMEHNAKAGRFRAIEGVALSRLRIEGTRRAALEDNADNNVLLARRCDRCFFEDIELAYMRKAGLELGLSMDSFVTRVKAEEATDVGGGGHGYGVAISYSQAITVRDSLFLNRMRHGVTVSWGSRENFVFGNHFDRGPVHAEQYASVDIHGQDDFGNLVERNWMKGAQEGIVLGGGGTSHGNDGTWNVIRNNHIEGTTSWGIGVFKKTWDSVLEDNVLVGTRQYGVRVDSGSDRTHVRRNRFESWAGDAISVNNSNDLEARGNVFVGGAVGVRITGTSSGYQVDGNVLNGATLQATGNGTLGANN